MRRGKRGRHRALFSVAVLAACSGAGAAGAAQPPGHPAFDVPAGSLAAHPCRASYQGKRLFSGRCMVNTKGREILVFSPVDGCTFTLAPSKTGFTGELSAYRNSCVLDQAADQEVEQPVPLGPLHRAGSCWTGAGAQVCVER